MLCGQLPSGITEGWAITLGLLALLSFAAMIPLSLLSHQVGNGVIAVVIGVPCAAVGLVVARRQQANPLGWLFLVIGVCLFLCTDGGDYALLIYHLGTTFRSARWDWSSRRSGASA